MYGQLNNDAYTVGLWRANGDFTDETGSYDLISSGPPAASYGLFDGAYDYSGVTQFAYNDDLDVTNDAQRTLEAIFKADDTSTSQSVICFKSRTLATTRSNYQIRINANDLKFSSEDLDSTATVTMAFSDTQNYHYAVLIQDGDDIFAYFDGVLVGSDSADLSAFTLNRFCIGAFWHDGNNVWGGYFDGIIDEARYSPVVRSAREIREIWNKMKGVY